MLRFHARGRGPAARALTLACLASLLGGCAGRDGARRRAWTPGAEGTTIGRDLRALPRGTVAPATSLGVDLVETGRERDEALARVGYEPARDRGDSGKSP